MEKFLLTKREFKEAMEILNKAAKDETRPILQGINFTGNRIAALDGYRLAVRTFETMDLKGSYTILASALKELKSLINKEIEFIDIEFNGENAKFILLDKEKNLIEEKIIELLYGSYINYKSLIPEEFEKSFILDSKKILDTIKPLKKNTTIMLEFIEEELKIYRMDCVETGYKKTKTEYVLIGTIGLKKKIDKEFKIAVNSTYFKEAIKDYKENFEINFNRNIDPILIRNNGKLDLVLPIRIVK